MADLIYPNEAKLNWLQAQIEELPTLTDCYLRLFKSALTIDRDSTLAELEAVQADYPGYAPILLENWTDSVIVDSDAITEPDVVSFQATEAAVGTLYGAYATNGAGDKLWFASRFTTSVPIPFTSELQVTLQVDFASIFSN